MNTKLSQFEDVETLKKVLVRDREALDAAATVDRYVQHLGQRDFKAYFDEPMEALAIVLPPQDGSSMAQLATFAITRAGWLTNVADNVFAAILRDNPKLVWTVKSDDENLTCEHMSSSLNNTHLSQKIAGRTVLIAQLFQGSSIKPKAVFPVMVKYFSGQVGCLTHPSSQGRSSRATRSRRLILPLPTCSIIHGRC